MTAQPEAPREPSRDWLYGMLQRRMTFIVDELVAAKQQDYAGTFIDTFMLTTTTWTVAHEPKYRKRQVVGYKATITHANPAGCKPQYVEAARWALESAGYTKIHVDDNTVTGHGSFIRFTPVAYA